jgi:predicted amidophosphoribosyltransferase
MAFFSGLCARVRGELLARRCRVCGRPVQARPQRPAPPPSDWPPPLICPTCAEALAPGRGGFCPRCGDRSPNRHHGSSLCPACRNAPRPFAAVAFHGAYQGLLRDMILAFKFGKHPEHAGVLRDLLAGAFLRAAPGTGRPAADREAPAVPDLLVPVPLHPSRLAWRGFNQSLELPAAVPQACKAHRCPGPGPHPGYQTPEHPVRPERQENIRGAFRADPSRVSGRVALLADDVMTTGATVEAASRALLEPERYGWTWWSWPDEGAVGDGLFFEEGLPLHPARGGPGRFMSGMYRTRKEPTWRNPPPKPFRPGREMLRRGTRPADDGLIVSQQIPTILDYHSHQRHGP